MVQKITTEQREVFLPENRARLWGEGQDETLPGERRYTPVVYKTTATPGFRPVSVPLSTLEGGWFHPALHEDLPALAELLT